MTHAPAQPLTRRSSPRWPIRHATVDDQIDVATFSALTRRRSLFALWQVFLQQQLQVREGKDKMPASWRCDLMTHDPGHRAPFIDAVAPSCARVLMSARSPWSRVLAVSSSFKLILYISPTGAFTKYITRATIGSALPVRTVARPCGRSLLVVVLHLLSNPSCCCEVGAVWTDVATLWLRGLVVPLPR